MANLYFNTNRELITTASSELSIEEVNNRLTNKGETEVVDFKIEVIEDWFRQLITKNKQQDSTGRPAYYSKLKSGLDGTDITHYEKIPRLEAMKKIRTMELGKHSQELMIKHGFSFDNRVFSLALEDMFYWNKIGQYAATNPEFFPFEIADVNGQIYSLAIENVAGFVGSGELTISMMKASERVFSNQIAIATTVEEIEAVVDNRT